MANFLTLLRRCLRWDVLFAQPHNGGADHIGVAALGFAPAAHGHVFPGLGAGNQIEQGAQAPCCHVVSCDPLSPA